MIQQFASLPDAVLVTGSLTLDGSHPAYRVGTLVVMPGGTLTMLPGSELVFLDRPIDTVADPDQFGNGLIVLGTLNIQGTAKTPFVRLAGGLAAGQSIIQLASAQPVGWQSGDRLLFPDSRQVANGAYQPEERRILFIAGNEVTLDAPLSIAHPGETDADGNWHFPHVANLTRDVVIRSENPNGVRGHVMLAGGAVGDMSSAAFIDLGRTTTAKLDSTTRDTAGNVTHIGTNQIGRYAGPHFHELDPTVGREYQFRMTGSVIDPGAAGFAQGRKWGTAIHGTSDGLVQGNVYYRTGGAAIATEDGSEVRNLIDGNFVCQVGVGLNSQNDDMGSNGDGIWLRGVHNTVTHNVVANITGKGGVATPIKAFANSNTIKRKDLAPASSGAPRDEWQPYVVQHPEWQIQDGNEYYASQRTLSFNYGFGSVPLAERTLFVRNLTAWNMGDGARVRHGVTIVGYNYEGAGAGLGRLGSDGFLTVTNARIKATVGLHDQGGEGGVVSLIGGRIVASQIAIHVDQAKEADNSGLARQLWIRDVELLAPIKIKMDTLNPNRPMQTVLVYWEHDLETWQLFNAIGGDPAAPPDAVSLLGVVGLGKRIS